MSRRLDAGFVAQLVAEHRLDEDEAVETVHDLVVTNPTKGVQAVTAAAARTGDLPRLSRALPGTPPAAPVRIVHLGVGNFHRAHQAWYTAHAPDGADWGIAAFTGRRPDMADALGPQDGLYTLITRSADGDAFELIGSLVRGPRRRRPRRATWTTCAAPRSPIVTITVTEAGYLARPRRPARRRPDAVAADVAALQADPSGSGRRRCRRSWSPGWPPAGRPGAGPITDPVLRQPARERHR